MQKTTLRKILNFWDNLVFGKINQNNGKQTDIRLVTNDRTRNIFASSLNFKGSKYISEFLQTFEMKKKKKKVKNEYGITLGLRKILIYEIHYDYMISKLGKKCQNFMQGYGKSDTINENK